jgi:hypothetical protein
MSAYIHRVTNQSGKYLQIVPFHPNDNLSYDVILGPHEAVSYANLFEGPGCLIPVVTSEQEYHDSHIHLDHGGDQRDLFIYDGKVFVGSFKSRSVLPGFSGPGAIELVMDEQGHLAGKVKDLFTGPQMAGVAWALARYALYGVNAEETTLLQKAWLTNKWDAWTAIGKPHVGLAGPLAAVCWTDWRYGIYALGKDGSIWERAWLTTSWTDWHQLDKPSGVEFTGLSAVTWALSRYGIYTVAKNGKLYQKWWSPTGWSGWEDRGAPGNVQLTGPVTAVSWTGYRYGIYALGSDGKIHQKWYGSSWSGWDDIGAPASKVKSLSATSWGSGQYVVAAVCEDGALWVREYIFNNHGWQAWRRVGNPSSISLTGPLSLVTWFTGRYFCYAQGSDGMTHQLDKGDWTTVPMS